MPITLRKINAQVKDPNTGEMIPAGILSSDSLTTIAAAENSAITRINNKKTQSLDAITSTGTTQVNAVTAAGTAAAANFPATEAATTTLANDFAPTYVPNQAYNVGDYCTYQYKIYKCKTPIAENTDAAFVTAHWDEIMITDEVGDLKESVYIQSVPTFQWVQGNISSSNGRDDNTTNYNLRLREQLYIGASNKILVSTIPNGYRIFTYKYSGPIADTYIGKGRGGWDTEAFELDGGYYYRFVVAYSDNSAITPENAPNITITTIDVTDKTLTLANKAADAKVTGEMIMTNSTAAAYKDMIAQTQTAMIATKVYTAGEYVCVNKKLYRTTTAITSGLALVVGTNVEEVKLAEAIATINNDIYYFNNDYPTFNIGSINTSTGKPGALTNRVRNSAYKMLYRGDYIINTDTINYRITVYKYNEPNTTNPDSYIGYEIFDNEKYEIQENKYYRIMGAKITNENFTKEEAELFGSIVYYGIRKNKIDDKANNSVVENKIDFPSINPYGSAGNVLSSNGDGTTTWINPAQPSLEDIETAVNAWFAEHPPAGVPDWSLSYKKLIKGTLGFISPLMFGAAGDGITDDSIAIQDTIEYAINNNITIIDGFNKTYLVSDAVSGDSSVVGSNKGVCIHGNIIFQNFNLILKNEVGNLTAVLNVYNNTNEKIIIKNVNIDGNWTNQNSVTTSSQDGGLHGIRIGFSNDCGFIEINNCNIQNCFTDGICTRPVNYTQLQIKNCYIKSNGRNGITDNAKSSYLENCIIIENGVRHNPKSGYHIEPDSNVNFGTKKLYNCTIKDNVVRDLKVYFNTKTYNLDSFEINSCDIGGISWGNHGTTEDCVHKNIKIHNSILGLLVYGNGDQATALNKFETFEISNCKILESVNISGGKDYESEIIKFDSVMLDGTFNINKTKKIIINGCQLKNNAYSVNIGDGTTNTIFTNNMIDNEGNEIPVDFGSCVNVVCCGNISNKTDQNTFSTNNATKLEKANNIFYQI